MDTFPRPRRIPLYRGSTAGTAMNLSSVDAERPPLVVRELASHPRSRERYQGSRIRAAVAGVPDPDHAGEVERRHGAPVRAEGDVLDAVGVLEHAQRPARVRVPDPGCPVEARRGEQAGIWAEHEILDPQGVVGEHSDYPARRNPYDRDLPEIAGVRDVQQAAVVAETFGADIGCADKAQLVPDPGTGGRAPDVHLSAESVGGDEATVRAEVEEDPGARVLAQPSGTAGRAILDLEGVGRTTPSGVRERQPGPVGTEDRPVRARCNPDRLLDSAGPHVPDLKALHERVVRPGHAAQSEATVPAEPGKEVLGRPENKWWPGRTSIEPPALDDLMADIG